MDVHNHAHTVVCFFVIGPLENLPLFLILATINFIAKRVMLTTTYHHPILGWVGLILKEWLATAVLTPCMQAKAQMSWCRSPVKVCKVPVRRGILHPHQLPHPSLMCHWHPHVISKSMFVASYISIFYWGGGGWQISIRGLLIVCRVMFMLSLGGL